jgi:hypothetical protein
MSQRAHVSFAPWVGPGALAPRARLACRRADSFPPPGGQPMSVPPAGPQVLNLFGTPPAIELSPGQLSGDAGLPPAGSGSASA